MLKKITDGTVVAERVMCAATFSRRLRGLMFTKTFPVGMDALILTPCNAVHTMFMRYSLDILFLDGENKVLHILEDMGPGRFSPVVKGASSVVEMIAGSVAKCGVVVGDRLSWNEKGKAVC